MSFISNQLLDDGPWQALERAVARLMIHGSFENVRLVGRTGDGGADILASRNGLRYVVQVKYRRSGSIGENVVDEVLEATRRYRAKIPVIATNRLFQGKVYNRQVDLMSSDINLQLWDSKKLLREWEMLPEECSHQREIRNYQQKPIDNIINAFTSSEHRSGLIIMATGLGKTFVASKAIGSLLKDNSNKVKKILVLAHVNELVYQLEKAFETILNKHQSTAVWNGYECGDLTGSTLVFACIDSVVSKINQEGNLAEIYDLIIIDEAHHAGSSSYLKLINETLAGTNNGPYLLGLTATPWRSDESKLDEIFCERLCCIDIAQGLTSGYLSNVDYRMHVDNINWENLSNIKGASPKELNKTLFIQEWDDAVIDTIRDTWSEINNPKGIIFCSRIEHAFRMADKINAMGFTRAEVIFSGSFNGRKMNPIDRSTTLCDFTDGIIGIICAVDIFNEGIDVPDVNIVVFQRVTHSRRIFIQQLGRGLRISPGKEKVIVLDFVSDVRRFAAGLDLKGRISSAPRWVQLNNPVKFINKTKEDLKTEAYLKLWLKDVAAIEDARDDDHILEQLPDLID